MLRRTLFILGSGSSFEVGLPIGRTLADRISTDLNIRHTEHNWEPTSGSKEISGALRLHSQKEYEVYRRSAVAVSAGLPFANSIDTFLDSHKDNASMQLSGKLGIVSRILDAERNSKLYLDPHRNRNEPVRFQDAEETWFFKLFRSLSDGVSRLRPQDIFESIAFINFNYDRCVEHFFFHAMQARFALNEKEAKDAIDHLRIIHPYGSVGVLPWEQQDNSVQFGDNRIEPQRLLTLTNRIKTFTEGIASDDLARKISEEVRNAETIVFLGFAFYRQNMVLLTQKSQNPIARKRQHVFGTALKISNSDQNEISASITEALSPTAKITSINLVDATCSELLDHIRKTLFK